MPDITRRHALGAAAALAVTVGAPLTAAAADDRGSHEGHGDHDGHQGLQPFDEVYRGRRIQGRPSRPLRLTRCPRSRRQPQHAHAHAPPETPQGAAEP